MPLIVYEVSSPLDLGGLWALHALDRPDLKDEPWNPVVPPRLQQRKLFLAGRLGKVARCVEFQLLLDLHLDVIERTRRRSLVLDDEIYSILQLAAKVRIELVR